MPCCCPRPCGPPGWLWLRGEYLAWFADGMDLPPLVTTSPAGTPAGDAGVLGESGTESLYGDQDILTEWTFRLPHYVRRLFWSLQEDRLGG